MQFTSFKDILIVYLSINLFANIKTSYGFQGYYYLKKIALSLSNIVYSDTLYLITLYNSSFFWAQVLNTSIWKTTIPIIVFSLEANKHIID